MAIIGGTFGSDNISGTEDDDLIFAGPGKDTVEAGSGDDIVFGGFGGDDIRGRRGDDLLIGSFGNDNISGNRGDDTLSGGVGKDTLTGGQGSDTLNGGLGGDTYVYKADDFRWIDKIIFFDNKDVLDIEGFSFGSDTITNNNDGSFTFDVAALDSSLTIKFGNRNLSFNAGDFV